MLAARGGQKLGDGQRTSTSCWTHAAPARELGYRVQCNHHTAHAARSTVPTCAWRPHDACGMPGMASASASALPFGRRRSVLFALVRRNLKKLLKSMQVCDQSHFNCFDHLAELEEEREKQIEKGTSSSRSLLSLCAMVLAKSRAPNRYRSTTEFKILKNAFKN